MKVLLISKYHFLKGGAEKVVFQEAKLLEEHGHEVVFFAMQHPENYQSKFFKYFISYEDEQSLSGSIKKFFRAIYSPEAAQKIKQLIEETRPDVAHLHFYDQMAPTILPILKKYNIPVVLTAHDYKLICPHYQLNKDGIVCSKNPWKHAWQTFVYKRFLESYSASLAVAVTWLINKFRKTYEKNIDLVIVPAKFMAEQLKGYGWNFKPVEVIPNFVEVPEAKKEGGEYVLFAGRLSAEKGIDVLTEVAKLLPNIPFCVAGTGDADLPAIPSIIPVGYRNQEELKEYYEKARLFFFPSVWEEVCPMVLLEASSFGLPVVATRVGGVAEIVEENSSGLLFNLGAKPSEIAELIRKLWYEPELRESFGKRGREIIVSNFSAERHYQRLVQVLSRVSKNK